MLAAVVQREGGGPVAQVAPAPRRVRRLYHRVMAGRAIRGQYALLTLTTCDEALGRDIHRDFRAFLKRLRRRGYHLEYVGVRERKAVVGRRGERVHLHLYIRAPYLPKPLLSHEWAECHGGSYVVDIQAESGSGGRQCHGARGAARYLAKYLAKETLGRFWISGGWIWRGWVGFCRRRHAAGGPWTRDRALADMRLYADWRQALDSCCRNRLWVLREERRRHPGVIARKRYEIDLVKPENVKLVQDAQKTLALVRVMAGWAAATDWVDSTYG